MNGVYDMTKLRGNKIISLMLIVGILVTLVVPAFAITDDQRSSNEETIYRFLCEELGLNSAAACGILANVYVECKFDPQDYYYGYYGIMQWGGSQLSDMEDFCYNNGYDYSTLEGQLQYVKYEMENRYLSIYEYMLNCSDDASGAYDAGYYWCYYYERPANKTNGSIKRGNLASGTFYPKYASYFVLKNSKSGQYTDGKYKDVDSEAWYADNIEKMFNSGVMIGVSPTRFDPSGNVTMAQVVTTLARIHRIYEVGEDDLMNKGGAHWYTPYLEYAHDNKLLSDWYYNYDMNALATRYQTAVILKSAIPSKYFTPYNSIADGRFKDLGSGFQYEGWIYDYCRSGVLEGLDNSTFNPNGYITRAEMSAILSRLIDSKLRIGFTLA